MWLKNIKPYNIILGIPLAVLQYLLHTVLIVFLSLLKLSHVIVVEVLSSLLKEFSVIAKGFLLSLRNLSYIPYHSAVVLLLHYITLHGTKDYLDGFRFRGRKVNTHAHTFIEYAYLIAYHYLLFAPNIEATASCLLGTLFSEIHCWSTLTSKKFVVYLKWMPLRTERFSPWSLQLEICRSCVTISNQNILTKGFEVKLDLNQHIFWHRDWV